MSELTKDKERDENNVNVVNLDEIDVKFQDAPTESFDEIKGLDANRYATKKTVAQGMLDIALLTSNASQLKYVLQVGQKHEFYTLLVILISISIVLQVVMGLVLLSLNLLRDCRFHEPRHRTSAMNIGYMTTSIAFVVTVLNILVSAFDSSLAVSAVVAVVLSLIFNINHIRDQQRAEILNNISLIFKIISITLNVVISVFYSMQIDDQTSTILNI